MSWRDEVEIEDISRFQSVFLRETGSRAGCRSSSLLGVRRKRIKVPVFSNKATRCPFGEAASVRIGLDLCSWLKLCSSCSGTLAGEEATGDMNGHSPPCNARSLDGDVAHKMYGWPDGASNSVADWKPCAIVP